MTAGLPWTLWEVTYHDWGDRVVRHLIPDNDLREHDRQVLTRDDECKSPCWCGATMDEEQPRFVVHNAMDRREEFEPDHVGTRKALA